MRLHLHLDRARAAGRFADLHPDRAGHALAARVAEAHAHWQRRATPLPTTVLALLVAAAVLASALPGPWCWLAGAVGGAALVLWLAGRDLLPSYVVRRLAGAEARRRTARVLRTAGASADGALLDGVLLESRCWRASVSVRRGVPTIVPDDDPDGAWTLPVLADRLRREAGPEVTPVVVVWADFPQRRVWSGGVQWLHGEELADWLVERPAPLRLAA